MKKWINCIKMIAMLAVLIDHLFGYLYTNVHINQFTYFSVSLFIILSGVTSFYSWEKNGCQNLKLEYRRKIMKVVWPYAFATIVYVTYNERVLNIGSTLSAFFNFNASPPLYFVLFYLELIIVSPILYILVKKTEKNFFRVALSTLIIIAISVLCTRYTYVPYAGLASSSLFGGTNLFLYFLGMLFASNERFFVSLLQKFRNVIVILLCTLPLISFVMYYIYNYGFAGKLTELFGTGINPPGYISISYSVLLFVFLSTIFYYLEGKSEKKSKSLSSKFISILSKLGSHTFFIFLFHYLVIVIFRNHNTTINIMLPNIWLRRVICIVLMVALPILMEKIYSKVTEVCIKFVNDNKQINRKS